MNLSRSAIVEIHSCDEPQEEARQETSHEIVRNPRQDRDHTPLFVVSTDDRECLQ